MYKIIYNFYDKNKHSESFSVLKLITGTSFSQFLLVASTPILSRIYTPESFGVMATFFSLISFVDVISSFRYELAVPLPDSDKETNSLVALCFLLVVLFSIISFFVVVVFSDNLSSLFGKFSAKYLLFLAPLSILLTGFYQPLNYVFIRKKKFTILASLHVQRTFVNIVASFSLFFIGPFGLIIAKMLSQIYSLFVLVAKNTSPLKDYFNIKLIYIFRNAVKYKKFAFFTTPSSLINVCGMQLPILLIASKYGQASLGQFTMAQTILLLPASLISTSVSQVFLTKANESYKENNLPAYLTKVVTKLFAISVFLALTMFILAPFSPYVLGDEWTDITHLIRILLPLFVGQIAISSVSMAFLVTEKNSNELLGQIIQFLMRSLPLFVAIYLNFDFNYSILAYSIGTLLGYCFYFILLVKSIKPYPIALTN